MLFLPAPERQKLGQTLPIIPNEIYFYIFEYIAPPDERLTPEQLHVLTSLCGVCRLFANVCLPRVFEIVVFSGPVFHDSTSARVRDNTAYKTSHESVLCAQLEAKQPLALAIAKVVRVCHFTGWGLDKAESCAVRLLSRKYITGMSYMTNLRELRFSDTLVDERHWNAIINSSSLEELSFLCCLFRRSPADVQPRKWVKVPRLQVLCCGSGGVRLPLAAINAQYLRALDMDHKFLDQVDWHLLSSLTELRFHDHHGSLTGTEEQFMERLHAFLMQAPRSLEELRLAVDVGGVAHVPVRSMFDHPAWRNLSLLRSLTFVVESISSDLFSHVSQTPSSSTLRLIDLVLDPFFSLGGCRTPRKSTITYCDKLLCDPGDLDHHANSRYYT